jgi:ATP-binding cassette, subfamily B, bacterial PglK
VKAIKQLWYVLTPQERVEGAFLFCAMVLGALFETVSVGLILPFIAVLKEPELLAKSERLRPFLSYLDISEPRKLFFILGPALIIFFAIKTGYLILMYRWLLRYGMKKHASLARQLMAGYLNAPYTFHLHRNSSEMIKATTRSVEDFTSGFMVNLLIVLGELLVLAALTGLLIIVEPLATLGALIVLAVPTALVYRSTQPRLAASGRIAEQSFGLKIQWAEQAISSVKEIMVTGRQSFFLDQHGYHVHRFADSVRSLTFLGVIPRFVIDTLAVSAMVAIAAILLARGQDLQSTLLLMGMFALAALRLIPSMSRMSSALATIRYRYASAEVIYHELHALQLRPSEPLPGSAEEQVNPIPFRRELVIEHLSYWYPDSRQPAIEDVSLEIPKGHWVAFIGPSGAGKTTLADLILGLSIPSSGRILMDGHDLHDNLTGWQRNIGYVPQTVYLIDDSVRRNIAFGVPDQEIDDERVWRALQAAQVDELVRSFRGGLSATVGQRGNRISGGERQRLGIARALYQDPSVLVVDEGTANLDNETEAAIVQTLEGLRGRKTIIVIAHRLPLVKNCDCIYLMRHGQLQNSGAYSDLVSTDPTFQQFAGSAPEFAESQPE